MRILGKKNGEKYYQEIFYIRAYHLNGSPTQNGRRFELEK